MYKHLSTLKIASLFFVAGLIAMNLFALPVQAQSSTFTFNPVADAYVMAADPTRNFGLDTAIRLDGSPVVNSYLRFDLGSLNGAITAVQLRLYANSSLNSGISVNQESSNSWQETAITYSNAPAIGGLLATSDNIAAGNWITIDLTPYITTARKYSIALTSTNVTALNLASRESGANAPQLVVTVNSSGTATSAPPKTATARPVATRTLAYQPTATKTPLIGPTMTKTQVYKPTSTPTQSIGGDPVLVGAGDISVCGFAGSQITANMLAAFSGAIFTTGDNSNDEGTASQFATCFDPTWGVYKSRIHPAVGNHEYLTSGASGYFSYFGAAAGDPTKGYYSYNLGAWHIVVLNSNCSKVGGCKSGNPQEVWLKADLAVHPNKCTLAIWHHPRFSSGQNGSYTNSQQLWQDLYNAGAELILNGHDHDYERFAPQDPSGKADPSKGIREIVVGTGGAGHTNFRTPLANSLVRIQGEYGLMKLTLHQASYDWQFIPEPGKTTADSGTDVCH